ncbi:MAG TPA: asparagine synthase-related protein [Solirubrobacteraceae bacterium]|jgi:asparagine synthase (glutamine-hydrolysing)|nr:asparagine synthase-related protein [Solirubrobacteraceae bacterium]
MTPATGLTSLELATGMVLGAGDVTPLPHPPGAGPLEALERAILPALLRPPCLVSFSGGRDSSAVLATAVALARREGLAPPIAATNVFPQAPAADEAQWQERLVRHLGLADWVRVQSTDELDVIGPYAQRLLRRHGLLWPFNAHFLGPLLDSARGGSLLTGMGGDELFGAARALRPRALAAGMARPEARDALRIAFAFAPQALRRRVLARREPVAFPWLRPRGREAATAALAAWSAGEPRGLRDRLAWVMSSRYLEVATASLELTADDAGVLLAHPLLSAPFWAEVGHLAAPAGFRSRTDGVRRVFGEVLPEEICARQTKAHFNEAFWTERSRAFVRAWDGTGVRSEFLDAPALRAHWREERPAANSFTALQALWLASADPVEEPAYSLPG